MQHSEYAQAVLSAHGSVLPGEDRRGVGDIIRPPRLATIITSEELPMRSAAHHLGGDLGLGARHVDLVKDAIFSVEIGPGLSPQIGHK